MYGLYQLSLRFRVVLGQWSEHSYLDIAMHNFSRIFENIKIFCCIDILPCRIWIEVSVFI